RQILHNGIAGGLSPLTRFYLLWRWVYKEAKVPFDEARKLAQSVGVNLEREWNRGFIKKEGEFIKVLGPHERDIRDFKEPKELIDVLHKALLLHVGERREEVKKLLYETGYGNNEAFYKVAQALSESLSNESKEKKLLDSFLAGKERLMRELKSEEGRQGELFS
ncbi:MAG: DNA methylase, partial [bacterium]